MGKVIDITTYQPQFTDSYFFDNNIWMLLFGPMADYERTKQRKYSEFLKKVQNKKNAIWINSLILSEFANSWLRSEYRKWGKLPENIGKNYKDHFLKSPKCNEVVNEIKIVIKKILQLCCKGNDDFNAIEINDIFENFGLTDFNDAYYIELAKKDNWIIVTDDSDFKKAKTDNLKILTIT